MYREILIMHGAAQSGILKKGGRTMTRTIGPLTSVGEAGMQPRIDFLNMHRTYVDFLEKKEKLQNIDGQVCVCETTSESEILIFKGIEFIAELFDKKIEVKKRDSSDYPYEKFVVVDGVKYLQLYEEE